MRITKMVMTQVFLTIPVPRKIPDLPVTRMETDPQIIREAEATMAIMARSMVRTKKSKDMGMEVIAKR